MKTKNNKTKDKWFGEKENQAFKDYYFNDSIPTDKKEELFNNILYPAYKYLALSIVGNGSWHIPLRLSVDDLMADVITFMHKQSPTYKEGRGKGSGAAISSYLHFIANRHVYMTWKYAKNRTIFESVSLDAPTDLNSDENIGNFGGANFSQDPDVYDLDSSDFINRLKPWWQDNQHELVKGPIVLPLYYVECLEIIQNGTNRDDFYQYKCSLAKKHNVSVSSVNRMVNVLFSVNSFLYEFYTENNKMPSAKYINDKLLYSNVNFRLKKYNRTII